MINTRMVISVDTRRW